jgi:hypothetical protein
MKKIDRKQLHKAVEALELERAMDDNVTEMVRTPYLTTIQDNEMGVQYTQRSWVW